MVVEFNNTGATVTMGKKWDTAGNCSGVSPETDSFDFTAWPRGDHTDPDDYSLNDECGEAAATCKAEIISTSCNFGSGSHSISFTYYDSYGRNLFSYSVSGVSWATGWIGRFGEKNLNLELYKPGRYYVIITADGNQAKLHFDVYGSSTTDRYLSKNGNDYGTGTRWESAKATWASVQTALSAGNNLFVAEGDYSSESGFSFSKSMNINPVKVTWGGYPNITDAGDTGPGSTGSNTLYCVSNPIEFDGTIDRWAFYSMGFFSQTVKLKIYRGGNAGSANRTTSTLIYTSDTHTETTSGWKTYTLSSPVSVQRGDILAIHTTESNLNVGLKAVTAYSYGLASSPLVSGDPGDTVIGDYFHAGYDLMLRAWNSGTQIEITLPKY